VKQHGSEKIDFQPEKWSRKSKVVEIVGTMAAMAFSVHVVTGLWMRLLIFMVMRSPFCCAEPELQFLGHQGAGPLVADEWARRPSEDILMASHNGKL
jgi:hypothetical protein